MRPSVLAVVLLATVGASTLLASDLATPVAPQVTREGEGYRIKTKYVVGAKLRFASKNETVVTGGPEGVQQPPTVEMTTEQEVLEVKDGVTTLRITNSGGPEGTSGEQTVRVDEKGKIVGQEGGALALYPSALPDHPLKPGETWTTEVDAPTEVGGAEKVRAEYKFAGMVEKDGRPAAQIDYKTTMGGKVSLEGAGSVLLDPDDGQLLQATMENAVRIELPGFDTPLTMTMKIEMKRLPPAGSE